LLGKTGHCSGSQGSGHAGLDEGAANHVEISIEKTDKSIN
jgi:hypothetical protein